MSTQRKDWAQAFGKAVRAAREQLGVSQEKFGPLAGLDRTYISGIERGLRNPTLWVISRLAKGLELTPSELVRRTEERLNYKPPQGKKP